MDIMETVIELTVIAMEQNQNAGIDNVYAAEIVDFMYGLKIGLEKLETGVSREDAVKELFPQRYAGFKGSADTIVEV